MICAYFFIFFQMCSKTDKEYRINAIKLRDENACIAWILSIKIVFIMNKNYFKNIFLYAPRNTDSRQNVDLRQRMNQYFVANQCYAALYIEICFWNSFWITLINNVAQLDSRQNVDFASLYNQYFIVNQNCATLYK